MAKKKITIMNVLQKQDHKFDVEELKNFIKEERGGLPQGFPSEKARETK